MRCEFIQQHIADLFDDQITEKEKDKLLLHVDQCAQCKVAMDEYNAIASALNPGLTNTSATGLSQAILDALMEDKVPVLGPGPRFGFLKKNLRIAASVLLFIAIGAGIIFMITYRKSSFAAERVLDNSIQAMTTLKTVSMVFSIRTSANENFESIDPAAGFLDFKVNRIFGTETRWRFEKPGRTIIMDGKDQYMVNEQGGYVLKGGPKAGFAGWMRLFLEPLKVLEAERSLARDHHSAYSIIENGDVVEVSVKAAALGKFDNPYALNTSIPEANTHRIYTFDRQTNILRSLAVFVKTGQEEICVLKLKSISGNVPLPDSLFVFINRNKWPVLPLEAWGKCMANGFKDIRSDEAASIFFNACGKTDWNTAERFSPLFSIPHGMAMKAVRERYTRARLLQVGRPFVSGLYAGEYVPYTLVTRTGDTISGNLALRNDNQHHVWIVDGGY